MSFSSARALLHAVQRRLSFVARRLAPLDMESILYTVWDAILDEILVGSPDYSAASGGTGWQNPKVDPP